MVALAMDSIPAKFRAELQPSKGNVAHRFTLDLRSLVLRDAGIEFDGSAALPILTEWSLVLTLPDDARFMAHVVVVSCDPAGPGRWHMALYFLHVEEIDDGEIQWLSA